MEPSILMQECGVRQTRNQGADEGVNRLRWSRNMTTRYKARLRRRNCGLHGCTLLV